MFLTETNIIDVTKKQYLFKLRAHYGLLTSLLMTQIMALLFSLAGTGSSGFGSNEITITVSYYTGNFIIAFTMLWAFISGVSINSKLVRNGDFSFVTNRLTSNLSSIGLLLTVTVLGGVTAMFGSSLLKVVMYFFRDLNVMEQTFSVPPLQLFIGIVATVCYVVLFGALGYLSSIIVQISRIMIVILPALFIGLLFIEGRTGGKGILAAVAQFFITESSFLVFVVKALIFSGIFFASAIALSDQLEVRK